ncbi:MAG: LytR C-terminal domain-containing protein [Pseudomonadota bacterium]
MHTALKRLSLACAGAMLLACADASYRRQVDTGPADVQESYLIARSHHMALRMDQATLFYMQALRAAPTHVASRNGLAALYAEQGYLGKAIALWEEMTAAQVGKGDAYLFSNIGYAYYLNGDMNKSREALERACFLDPLNHRAWKHLGATLEKLGHHDKARAMFRQAATLQGHDLRSDYAVAAGAGLPGKGLQPMRNWAQTEVVQTPGGMFVMRRVEAEQEPQAAAAPAATPTSPVAAAPAAPAVQSRRARLEIRNGNGVTGMARSLAKDMGEADPQVVRVTNHKGYGVRQTRIEYQPAFRDAAHKLATRVGSSRVVPVTRVDRADMRLIIGRDLAPVRAAAARAPVKEGGKAS